MTNTNTLRIFIEQHPNKELRTFHVDRCFVDKVWNKYDDNRPAEIDVMENALKALPEIGDDSSWMVSKANIRVERNPVFEWAEVHDVVIDVICKHFGNDRVNTAITIGERDPEWDRPQGNRDMF